MSNFGYVDNEFINLYSDENPILEIGDNCYYLVTNIHDYHRPLICRGIVISDRFTDGMNKIYYIKCLEILESPNIISKFFIGKTFQVYSYDVQNLFLKSQKNMTFQVIYDYIFSENLFPIESFFVRNTYEKISNLRKEYINIIKKDLIKQISDIDSI